MSWIESHQSLSRHRKTLRAASLLKVDRHKLIGHLHELWWWGLDNAGADGQLDGISELEIATAAGWPERDAGRFVKALCAADPKGAAGFLEVRESHYVLHDWFEYAGKFNDQVELRRQSNRDAQRQRRQRLRQRENDDNSDDCHHDSADKTADAAMTKSDSQHPTVPNRTQPNLTLPNPDPSDQNEADASSATVGPRKPTRQVRRLLDAEAIAQIQAEPENADVDVAAVAADYLNWTGSDKHRDQVQALRNQLDIPGKRERFPRRTNRQAVEPQPFDLSLVEPDPGLAERWASVLDRLRGKLHEGTFSSFLAGSEALGWVDGTAFIRVNGSFRANHCNEALAVVVRREAHSALQGANVFFVASPGGEE